MWMMGIANSYTMEASFAGSSSSNRADTHFSTFDYEQMGKTFCQTLLDFYDEDPKKVAYSDLKFVFGFLILFCLFVVVVI